MLSEKALKEGKPYKEPGVYIVRGNKKKRSLLTKYIQMQAMYE